MSKIDLARFQSNPVMLYNHKERVGIWEDVKLEDGKLTGVPKFKSDTTSQQLSKDVEEGFLKGASLGFHIKEVDTTGDVPVVVAEPYECSVCDVPANVNALALYNEAGELLVGEQLTNTLSALKKTTKPNEIMESKLSASTLVKLGLTAEAKGNEIDEAVAGVIAENAALKADKKAALAAEIDTIITTAIAEGRAKADEKQTLTDLGGHNLELLKSTLKMRPGRKELAVEQGGKGGDDRSNWTFDDWRKKDPQGMLSMKAKDPEAYTQLLQKKS